MAMAKLKRGTQQQPVYRLRDTDLCYLFVVMCGILVFIHTLPSLSMKRKKYNIILNMTMYTKTIYFIFCYIVFGKVRSFYESKKYTLNKIVRKLLYPLKY